MGLTDEVSEGNYVWTDTNTAATFTGFANAFIFLSRVALLLVSGCIINFLLEGGKGMPPAMDL